MTRTDIAARTDMTGELRAGIGEGARSSPGRRETIDLVAASQRRLGAGAGDGECSGRVRPCGGLGKRTSLGQGHGKRAGEGITGPYGILGEDRVRWNSQHILSMAQQATIR